MPTTDQIRYERNFLENVVCRLDYHPILLIQSTISPEFQESIRGILPIFEEQKGIESTIKLSNGKPESESRPVSNWIFQDQKKKFKLTITYNFIAFEDFAYSSLEPYLEIIKNILDLFESAYENISYKRIGLRYINKVQFSEGDPLDWSQYIAEPLIHSLDSFIVDKNELSRAMNQFVINRDEYLVTVNFGIHNGEFPAKIARREYILDYDCHSAEIADSGVISQLKQFNDTIVELFEKSINTDLKNEMGVKA